MLVLAFANNNMNIHRTLRSLNVCSLFAFDNRWFIHERAVCSKFVLRPITADAVRSLLETYLGNRTGRLTDDAVRSGLTSNRIRGPGPNSVLKQMVQYVCRVFSSYMHRLRQDPRTSHHRLFQDSHYPSGFEWRSGVSSANVEEIPRPLLWGASRDSFRDQDESSIIADSMIAQSCAKKERVSAAPLRFPIAV